MIKLTEVEKIYLEGLTVEEKDSLLKEQLEYLKKCNENGNHDLEITFLESSINYRNLIFELMNIAKEQKDLIEVQIKAMSEFKKDLSEIRAEFDVASNLYIDSGNSYLN